MASSKSEIHMMEELKHFVHDVSILRGKVDALYKSMVEEPDVTGGKLCKSVEGKAFWNDLRLALPEYDVDGLLKKWICDQKRNRNRRNRRMITPDIPGTSSTAAFIAPELAIPETVAFVAPEVALVHQSVNEQLRQAKSDFAKLKEEIRREEEVHFLNDGDLQGKKLVLDEIEGLVEELTRDKQDHVTELAFGRRPRRFQTPSVMELEIKLATLPIADQCYQARVILEKLREEIRCNEVLHFQNNEVLCSKKRSLEETKNLIEELSLMQERPDLNVIDLTGDDCACE